MIFRNYVLILLLLAPATMAGSSARTRPRFTRAVATLNGVFSPRGFFNITVRLYQLQGLESAKFDLKKSQITLDFAAGVTVTPKEIRQVMVDAGYKPGPVRLQSLLPGAAAENGPGWMKIKHPAAKNAFIRWFQLNF